MGWFDRWFKNPKPKLESLGPFIRPGWTLEEEQGWWGACIIDEDQRPFYVYFVEFDMSLMFERCDEGFPGSPMLTSYQTKALYNHLKAFFETKNPNV